jgi:hypothetical protein
MRTVGLEKPRHIVSPVVDVVVQKNRGKRVESEGRAWSDGFDDLPRTLVFLLVSAATCSDQAMLTLDAFQSAVSGGETRRRDGDKY